MLEEAAAAPTKEVVLVTGSPYAEPQPWQFGVSGSPDEFQHLALWRKDSAVLKNLAVFIAGTAWKPKICICKLYAFM